MHCCQIQHNFKYIKYLCKLRKEYLISLISYFYSFSGQNLEIFDVSQAVLPITVAKLSTLNDSPVFLAHAVVMTIDVDYD